ncbi:hypothetical protein SpCBS45565_g01869 [Spizellomyces sp. 'palustris']|nr:hypothetical protein SpCBS45565_g01869 [Spizellomyces sp. 'palustris']
MSASSSSIDVPSPYAIPPPSVPPPEEPNSSLPPIPLLLLDHSQSLSPATKPEFLYWLRMAILYHGSFYLTNTGIPEELTDQMAKSAEELFKISDDEKAGCSINYSPGFLGWCGIVDGECRETWEFGPDLDGKQVSSNAPPYARLRYARNQYPSEAALSNFKGMLKGYNKFLTDLAFMYNELILEALGVPTGAFDGFFDEEAKLGGRIKFTRYFRGEDSKQYGEAPYRDAWLSFLMFANDVPGVEMLSEKRQTLTLPPLPSTLLVQTGTALSFATHHAVLSLPHRVLQPPPDAPDSLTIRYAMQLRPNLPYEDILKGIEGAENMNEEAKRVRDQRRERRKRGFEAVRKVVAGIRAFKGTGKAPESTSKEASKLETVGDADLYRRIKSRPTVGKKWYPEISVESVPASS